MSTKIKKIILGVFTLMLAFVLGATLSLRENKQKVEAGDFTYYDSDSSWSFTSRSSGYGMTLNSNDSSYWVEFKLEYGGLSRTTNVSFAQWGTSSVSNIKTCSLSEDYSSGWVHLYIGTSYSSVTCTSNTSDGYNYAKFYAPASYLEWAASEPFGFRSEATWFGSAQVQLWPCSDNVSPTISTFSINSSSSGTVYTNSTTVSISTTTSDNTPFREYCLNTNSSASSCGTSWWPGDARTPPTSYTFSADGTYSFYLHIQDRWMNKASKGRTVVVDRVQPSLSTSGTSTTWTKSNRTITLSGSDDRSGVAAYYCGSSWISSTASSYSCTFSSTTKTATVGVKDKAGNQRTTTVNVYVDKTNPTSSATGTSTTWTSSNRTITINGADDHSGVASYYCGGSWISSTSASYGCVFSSTTTTATVGVKDKVGNQYTYSVNVYVDKTAPVWSVSGGGLLDGKTYYVKPGASLTVSFSDSHSGIWSYSSATNYYKWGWSTSTSTYPSYSTSFTSTTSSRVSFSTTAPTTAGYHYICVYYVGQDAVSNLPNSSNIYNSFSSSSAYAWFQFYVDTVAPTLTVSSTSSGTRSGSGTSAVYYAKSGDSLTVSFSDNMNLYYYSSTSYYRFLWCGSDDYYEYSDCYNVLNDEGYYESVGTSRSITSVSGTITVPSASTGTYIYLWIEGDVRDYAGWMMSNSTNMYGEGTSSYAPRIFKFYIDNTNPTNSVSCTTTWKTSYVIDNTSSYIYSSISDAHSGLYSSYVYVKKAGASSYSSYSYTSGSYIYATSSYLATGLNYVYFQARDKAGNINTSSTYTLYLDETHPTVTRSCTGSWCDGATYVAANTSNYVYSTNSDAHSGLNTQYVYIKKAGATSYTAYTYTSGTKIYSNSSYFDSGDNYVYFYATDKVGNSTTSSTYTLYVDKTNPVVTRSCTGSWCDGSTYVAANTSNYVYSTNSDAHSGLNIQYVYVKKAGATSYTAYTYTSGTKIYSNSSYFASGVNYVYFYATDNVGNSTTSSTYTLYVDKTNPTATVTTTFSSSYVDLENSKVYIPFVPSDAHSGFGSATATNGGSYSSNKMWFPISSISNKTLSFTYTVKDKVGNTLSKAVTIDVSLTYDDTLKDKVKTGMNNKLDTGKTLTSQNSGKQVSYVFDSDAATILANLGAFGINADTKTVNTKYVFVSKTLSADLSVYNSLAKPTTLTALKNGITSPLGQKGDVYLVLLFEDMGIHVASGSIGAASATALSSTFDTYTSAETTYQGAGLGEDGTVVSFSDDANSTMAVTLGASNMIEKRDVYGNLEWEKAITSSGKIELKKVINNEYGILVLGETTSGSVNGTNYPFKGGKDILVIRLDKQGNILFTNVIGTEGNDAIVAGDMNDNRIALLSSNEECTTMFTMNIDGTGIKQQTVNENASNISIKGNKIVVIGTTNNEIKASFVQLYENDSLVWTRTLSGSKDVNFYSLGLDDRNIYVVGQTQAMNLHDNMGTTKILESYGELDSIIAKYDYEGNIIQVSTIGGEGNDTFNQILVTSNKVIVAGTSSSSDVSASHYLNSNFHVNKLGEVDTLIVTLNKDLIIEDGLNLSYEEGMELQEIGINQYTEQLMILSSEGVHTQRITEDTLKFEVNYDDGILTVKANEEIANAVIYDGNEYIEIGEGIEIAPGAYQVTVTSSSGITKTEVVNVDIPVINEVIVVEHSILPMIAMFTSIMTLAILTILVIKKYKKEYVQA